MLLVQAIPAICLFVGMWRAGKPALADQQNRHDEALHILKQIRPAERAQKEYDDISTLIKIEAGNKYSAQSTFATIVKTPDPQNFAGRHYMGRTAANHRR